MPNYIDIGNWKLCGTVKANFKFAKKKGTYIFNFLYFKEGVNLVLEKFDFYNEMDTNKTYSHILYDSYNHISFETDEISDYLPASTSKTYNCMANDLRDGKLLGKTKLLIQAPHNIPHIIKYIYVEKSLNPLELHEYHSNHQSGLLYTIFKGENID